MLTLRTPLRHAAESIRRKTILKTISEQEQTYNRGLEAAEQEGRMQIVPGAFRSLPMRAFNYSVAAGFASMSILASASAAEMTAAEIQSLVSGKTGYVKTAPSSVTGAVGEGVIYWAADGNNLYKTPQGPIWHGTWFPKGNLYCSEYKEGPKRPCMRVEKQGDAINLVDSESGQIRATVVKTAPGNVENLK
jgi:hypothetical protein